MSETKEFYFVRHGQTDHNLLEGHAKGDYHGNVPLNNTGRAQATAIEPLIATLPIQTICASPFKRAQETKEILTARLQVPHHSIEDLGECNSQIWEEMFERGIGSVLPDDGQVLTFINTVQKGIEQALALPGPSLIVAHGGVHWAVCCLLNIQNHNWSINNCGVVRFSLDTEGKWTATKLA